MAKQTLGIKNRNPWNVKTPKPDTWLGQTGEDSRGHAVFSDPAYSCRAAIKTLRIYQRKGRNTLLAIFDRYAPSSDGNQPNKYAEFVARRARVGIDTPLNLFADDGSIANVGRLEAVLRAMAEYENFNGYDVGDRAILIGLGMYLGGLT